MKRRVDNVVGYNIVNTSFHTKKLNLIFDRCVLLVDDVNHDTVTRIQRALLWARMAQSV